MSIQVNVMLAGEPLQVNIVENFEVETVETDFFAADFICKTVGDLRNVIQENSKFDGHSMKLIYKGKMISMDPAESLQKYGFKTGDRLMGLGKPKTELIEDVGLRELRRFEKEQLAKLAKTYDEIKFDMELVEKHFLDAKMTNEMIGRLTKRVLHFIDVSEKHLSTIDGIKIFDDGTPETIRQRNREVRKTMINGIQEYLNFNDKFKFRLEQLRNSLEDQK